MNPLEMTGLEIMQAFAQGLVPEPGIAKTMPMKPLEVEHGRIVFSAIADERHTNPLGGVHGGFAATVLDSVTGSCCWRRVWHNRSECENVSSFTV